MNTTQQSAATFFTENATLIKLTASKQSELFETLRQLQFSGQLLLTGRKGQKWSFHLYLGHLIYATGGTHPVRRWRRILATYCPELSTDDSAVQQELINSGDRNGICWQYQLLNWWVEQQRVARPQATRMIWAVIVESLFDTLQAAEVAYELKPEKPPTTKLVLIDAQQAVAEVERQWLIWHSAKLPDYSPNLTPTIKNLDQLQERTSASVSQMLSQLLDGQKSLRDLAVQMQRDVATVLRSLLPYIQSDLVELINIPDLPAPVFGASVPATAQKPLIACVDDSPLICQAMEKFLTESGYRFVGANDPLRAIGVLLALKPNLIFLDLMMPNANGYEICSKLRKIPLFRNTPIVILTGNDGVIDRVRAKMVGATDFLSKTSVDAEKVQEVLCKHLRHCMFTNQGMSEPARENPYPAIANA